MNIFVLDNSIRRCAQYHCDQHVVKMILESIQIMCTALNKKGFNTPYQSTHVKHPCILWVEQSYDNFKWLGRLAVELNREYKYRYRKQIDHKSMQVLSQIQHCQYQTCGLTPFAQAMPDEYKVAGNAVQAYRQYYIHDKLNFAKWTRRKPPHWIHQ